MLIDHLEEPEDLTVEVDVVTDLQVGARLLERVTT
jgi:hypothetical protein